MNKKVDLILCADLHRRETQPECRLDDFVEDFQWQQLRELSELQAKYDCPVICSGDLLDHWDTSPWFLTKMIKHLPANFYTIFGQHEFPNHSYEHRNRSGLTTLHEDRTLDILPGLHWGQKETPQDYTLSDSFGIKLLVMHKFVWDGKNWPWPSCNQMTAEQVLDQYPDYNLIVTGDYHKGFTFKRDGQLLVNPGCFSIQAADYKDYRPRVYLWNAENNEVEPYYMTENFHDITTEYIDHKKARDEKLEQLVEGVKKDWQKQFGEYASDPEKILERFFMEAETDPEIQQIIYKSLKHKKNE